MKNLAQKGFTMIELIFVIAIILSLTAIFAPLAMDKLGQSKSAKAQADIDALAAALVNFFSDLSNFPSCSTGADCDPLDNASNNLKFLAVCTAAGSCVNEYPAGAAWSLTTNDHATTPAINNAYNHLVLNDPNADGTAGDTTAGTKDYRPAKWKGPYVTKLGVDPWGKAYIIHVGAMQKTGSPISAGKGWILSGGPDGTLDTGPTDTALQNDDIGYIFCTDC